MNKVKYSSNRKYRDVIFDEVAENEPHIRPKRSILIQRKISLFQRIKKTLKCLFKK
jgi:hypothetical protein